MVSRKDSNIVRLKRHKKIRSKISGTASRPRLAVYRSNANISAQIIDDVAGVTLVSASTLEKLSFIPTVLKKYSCSHL